MHACPGSATGCKRIRHCWQDGYQHLFYHTVAYLYFYLYIKQCVPSPIISTPAQLRNESKANSGSNIQLIIKNKQMVSCFKEELYQQYSTGFCRETKQDRKILKTINSVGLRRETSSVGSFTIKHGLRLSSPISSFSLILLCYPHPLIHMVLPKVSSKDVGHSIF